MSHQSGCTPASFRHLPSASSVFFPFVLPRTALQKGEQVFRLHGFSSTRALPVGSERQTAHLRCAAALGAATADLGVVRPFG